MITVNLTLDEIDAIIEGVSVYKMCEDKCYYGYNNIGCYDLGVDGKYKCRLMRAVDGIHRKLGGYRRY